MNSIKSSCEPPRRYSERVTAVDIVNRYFSRLARCGKACRESQKRRMHWKDRQIAGRAARKPKRIDRDESQSIGLSHERTYRQKNTSAFCRTLAFA
jgi:hypothetical protein